MYSTLKMLRLFASMERQAWGSSAPPTEAALEDFFAETHSSIELIMNREPVIIGSDRPSNNLHTKARTASFSSGSDDERCSM